MCRAFQFGCRLKRTASTAGPAAAVLINPTASSMPVRYFNIFCNSPPGCRAVEPIAVTLDPLNLFAVIFPVKPAVLQDDATLDGGGP